MENKSSPTLIDLDKEYRHVVAAIENYPEDSEEGKAYLAEVALSLCEKVDGYLVVSERLEAGKLFWKSQKDHCAKAEKVLTNALQSLKERMKFVLSNHPEKSLQGNIARFYLSKGGDTLILDDTKIPNEYKITKIETVPDKEKIERDLRDGKIIPGAALKQDNYRLLTGRPK